MSDTAFHTTVAQILDGSTKPIDAPDEAAYLEEWTKSAAPLPTPLAQAIAGGAIADRLAWVFVAGYQAALRRVFPELPVDGFAAYVASEDRKGELPGVAVLEHKDGFSLAGNKTWVASSDHVQHLVISAGEREETCFYLIHREAEGVSMLTYDRASYLGDMSQGRVTFEGAFAPPERAIAEPVRSRSFSNAEPLHVLTAAAAFMLSHTRSHGGPISLQGRALATIAATSTLAEAELTEPQVTLGLVGVSAALQTTATEFEAFLWEADEALLERWSADRRLINMFTAGLERRAGG
jgi:hypothetical protein